MAKISRLKDLFEVVEVCDKVGLFTNGRLQDDEVPEGVYKYLLREDDDGQYFASLEKNVSVNFGGTILLKEEVNLGEENRICFSEETSPNFLGDEITLREYLDEEYETKMEGM